MLYKKSLVFALLFAPCLLASAKTIAATDSVASSSVEHVAPMSEFYIELVGTTNQLNGVWNVQVQTGTTFLHRTGLKSSTVTQFAKTVGFKTLVDALNHFAAFGWQLQQSYVLPAGGGHYATHWILSKESNDIDDVVKVFSLQ